MNYDVNYNVARDDEVSYQFDSNNHPSVSYKHKDSFLSYLHTSGIGKNQQKLILYSTSSHTQSHLLSQTLQRDAHTVLRIFLGGT